MHSTPRHISGTGIVTGLGYYGKSIGYLVMIELPDGLRVIWETKKNPRLRANRPVTFTAHIVSRGPKDMSVSHLKLTTPQGLS